MESERLQLESQPHPFISYVTLGIVPKLSDPQISNLEDGGYHKLYRDIRTTENILRTQPNVRHLLDTDYRAIIIMTFLSTQLRNRLQKVRGKIAYLLGS